MRVRVYGMDFRVNNKKFKRNSGVQKKLGGKIKKSGAAP
jgi:hypothetical protein